MKRRKTYRTTLGPHFNEGARMLWVATISKGIGSAGVAALADLDQSSVYRWMYGDQKPARSSAEQLKKHFGIDPSLWDERPREQFSIPDAA
jgi:hypothetical protein